MSGSSHQLDIPPQKALSPSGSLRWIVCQEGSRQSYAIPLAFHRIGALRLTYADIWCRFGRGILRHGPAGARALATRYHPELPADSVVSFSTQAIFSRWWFHSHHSRLKSDGLSRFYIDFGKWYALKVRRHLETLELNPNLDCFFGFNTNCLEILDLLKSRRIFTVVDQIDPGRVEEKMILEEVQRWPGWAVAPDPMSNDYWQRIQQEWQLADAVLVNSEWSRLALLEQGVSPDKIMVIPLAIDLNADHAVLPVDPQGPLKVLWLGSVILRKGIPYLIEAARKLQHLDIQFLLAGPVGISPKALASFPPNVQVLGRVTRDQLSQFYRQAHLFVLPTISDGFAITQLEAMAHALPVITTPNCGNVVTDQVDGLIVPARDSQALADAIAKMNSNRALLRDMSAHALLTVRKFDLPSNARLINAVTHQFRDYQFGAETFFN